MRYFGVLAALAAASYLYYIIQSYQLKVRAALNHAFMGICMAFLVFCFFMSLYSLAEDHQMQHFWYKMAALGWCTFPGFVFYFYYLLVNNRIKHHIVVLLAVILPGLVFFVLNWQYSFWVADLVDINGVRFPQLNMANPLFWFFLTFMIAMLSASLLMTLIWGLRSRRTADKETARLLLWTGLLNMGLNSLSTLILPLLSVRIVPDLAHVTSLLFAWTIWKVNISTGLLKGFPSQAVDRVIDEVHDLILAVDSQGIILDANRQLLDTLDYELNTLRGQSMDILFADPSRLQRMLKNADGKKTELTSSEIIYKTRSGNEIPAQINGFSMERRTGIDNRIVLIGHNIKPEKDLLAEIDRRLHAEENERQHTQNLLFLSRAALSFVAIQDEDELLHLIAQKTREITGNSLIMASTYSPEMDSMILRAVSANPAVITTISQYLGGNPVGLHYRPQDNNRDFYTTGKLTPVRGGLYELTGGILPEKNCRDLEKKLHFKSIYTIGFVRNNEVYGHVMIFLSEQKEVKNSAVLETFIHQASVALQRRLAEEKNREIIRKLTFLSGSLETYFENISDDQFFEWIAGRLSWFMPGSLVVVSEYSEVKRRMQIRALQAPDRMKKILAEAIPYNFKDLQFDLDQQTMALMKTGKFTSMNGIFQSNVREISEQQTRQLESQLKISDLYSGGFVAGGRLFGNVLVALTEDCGLFDRTSVESFMRLCSMACEQRRSLHNLETLNAELEERVNYEISQNREKDHLIMSHARFTDMSELIRHLSHHWRQPLNVIGITLQKFREMVTEGIPFDHANAERELSLSIENLLRLSRLIEEFRKLFEEDAVEKTFLLRDSINRVMLFLEDRVDVHKIAFSISGQENLAVRGFPNEYAQALLAILQNAVDALVYNGVQHPRIDIRLEEIGGRSCLTVTDNAGGIPEDRLPRIFDAYFSTKEGGTGMGLYIARLFIEKRMAGTLTVENRDGGACFTLTV